MALYFYAGIDVSSTGQVSWNLCSSMAAEDDGVARVDRRGNLGDARPDDGSGRIQTAVLVALESLGHALLDVSRDIAWSYSMLPDLDFKGTRAPSLLG